MGGMPDPNRVTPVGEIVAIDQRGLFMGNRGCMHRDRQIVRPWQVRRWITCVLEYKGWVAPEVGSPAGGRPCSSGTRRWRWPRATGPAPCAATPTTRAWLDAWEARVRGAAHGSTRWTAACTPTAATAGASAATGPLAATCPPGRSPSSTTWPVLVLADRLVPWSPAGYGPPIDRPGVGDATVLTPRSTVAVLRHGYRPVVHHSAGSPA